MKGIEDPDANSHTYGHLIFDKEAKIIQCKKGRFFIKWCWYNWMLACVLGCLFTLSTLSLHLC